MKSHNFKIWTLTDGSEGMISQVLGLAQELGNEVIQIKTELLFPWSFLQPGIIPTFKWIFNNQIPIFNKPNIIKPQNLKSLKIIDMKKNQGHAMAMLKKKIKIYFFKKRRN